MSISHNSGGIWGRSLGPAVQLITEFCEILGMERLCWGAKHDPASQRHKLKDKAGVCFLLLSIGCSSVVVHKSKEERKFCVFIFKGQSQRNKSQEIWFYIRIWSIWYIWKALTNLTSVRLWCSSDERKQCFWKSYIMTDEKIYFSFYS